MLDFQSAELQKISVYRNLFRDAFPDAPEGVPFEVVFDKDTHDADGSPAANQNVRMLEVWTQNRVYIVNQEMICAQVIDRRTGVIDAANSNLGARLAGGQRKYDKTLHISRPFPVPGTEAVFELQGKRHVSAVTSKVVRVVLHRRVTTVVLDQKGAFDDVTSALLMPSQPPKARKK